MAGLDDLFNEIPIQQIAAQLGADEGEVTSVIHTLVPTLLGSVQHNVQSGDIDSSKLESAVTTQAASGLLDGGVSVDQVDQNEGNKLVANIFGGNDSNQVASALSGGGVGSSDLIKKLLPILAPIVLAYIGKQLTNRGGAAAPAQPQAQASGGGIGDVLGSILGGAGGGGGNNALGSILGSVLGGGGGQGASGNVLGDILGGLLGGKK